MKLISFMNQGAASYGAVHGDRVLDLKPLLGAKAPDLKALITQPVISICGYLGQDAISIHPKAINASSMP